MYQNITTMSLTGVWKCEQIFSAYIANEQTGDSISEHNLFFWLVHPY
jgi:hypothetical protein